MRRPLVLALFVALFAAEIGWAGIAPLIPDLRDRYGLTETQAGLVFTLASVGILLASLPAGALSRRFAVRTMTLWAMASITAANLSLAMANTFPVVLAGRVLFGVGLGTMWVAGTAWIHDAAGEDASRALAMTTPVVGVGALLGPAFAGFVAERISLGGPFWILGAGALATTLVLLVMPSSVGREPEPSPPLADMLRAAGADLLMLTSIVLTLAVSMMWMTADLLVPLRLDEHGFSAAGIGLALSLASVAFTAMSGITARHADGVPRGGLPRPSAHMITIGRLWGTETPIRLPACNDPAQVVLTCRPITPLPHRLHLRAEHAPDADVTPLR